MNVIESTEDLQKARSERRAMLFVWVNWSIPALNSEKVLCDFVSDWRSCHPDNSIPVYRVDLSHQDGELWNAIRSWLQDQGLPVDQLTYGGNGALLWIRNGSVVVSVPNLNVLTRSKLLTATMSIFGSNDQTTVCPDIQKVNKG